MLVPVVFSVALFCVGVTVSTVEVEHLDQHDHQNFIRNYSVVIPSRIISKRHTRDLSTSQEGSRVHVDSPSFFIPYHGRNFILDLHLQRTLVSGDYTEDFTGDDNKQRKNKVSPEACHYQGTIRGSPDSFVVMSTCKGLQGYFSDGKETFHIEPHPEPGVEVAQRAHIIYTSVDIKEEKQMKYAHNDTTTDRPSSFMDLVREYQRKDRRKREAKVGVHTHNYDKDTRYAKLVLIFDRDYWIEYQRDMSVIRERAITIANHVDRVFGYLNFRIILVGIKVWSSDSNNPLESYSKAYGAYLVLKYWRRTWQKPIHHDVAILVVGKPFNKDSWTILEAPRSKVSACFYATACGVVRNHSWKPVVAVYIAHAIGTIFGMGDGRKDAGRSCNKCLWKGGCVMTTSLTNSQEYVRKYKGWTKCNVDDIAGMDFSCMLKPPPTPFYAAIHSLPVCGNGVTEEGEECDCGSEEDCPYFDPCCQVTGCKLKPNFQCSKGACCQNCLFKPRGVICRNVSKKCEIEDRPCPSNFINDCDIADVCTGSSPTCVDHRKQDATPCDEGRGYCYEGKCRSPHLLCRKWFGEQATAAVDDCYAYHWTGSYRSHCGKIGPGINDFKRCSHGDYKCGKVQCTWPSAKERLPVWNDTRVDGSLFHIHEWSFHHYRITNYKESDKDYCRSFFGNTFDGATFQDVYGIKHIEEGLAENGSKCGDGKLCIKQTCVSTSSLGLAPCPVINGKTCAGNGECNRENKCVCVEGYDPATSCRDIIPTPKPTTTTTQRPVPPAAPTTAAKSNLLLCHKCSDDETCWIRPDHNSQGVETCPSTNMVCQVLRNATGTGTPLYTRGCILKEDCSVGCIERDNQTSTDGAANDMTLPLPTPSNFSSVINDTRFKLCQLQCCQTDFCNTDSWEWSVHGGTPVMRASLFLIFTLTLFGTFVRIG